MNDLLTPTPSTNPRTPGPRLGFVGVGWIGRHRLEAVARSASARIVAIADPVNEQIEQAAPLAPGARLSSSLDALLEEEGLDGVVIATPSALHAEQAIKVLERGMAVFCQKPLARTAPEARQVVETARRADQPLAVDFCYRFVRGMPMLRELVLGGGLGEVFAVDLTFHNAYGPDKPWFYDVTLAGGGCVMDLGVHLVDLALWSLDFPAINAITSRLYAQGKPLAKPVAQVEDYAVAEIELAMGATIRLSCSWRLSAGCDAVIEAAFYGTRGGAALRNVNGSFYDFMVERFQGTRRETLASYPDAWGGRALLDWVQRLALQEDFDAVEGERLVQVAAILDEVYGR